MMTWEHGVTHRALTSVDACSAQCRLARASSSGRLWFVWVGTGEEGESGLLRVTRVSQERGLVREGREDKA